MWARCLPLGDGRVELVLETREHRLVLQRGPNGPGAAKRLLEVEQWIRDIGCDEGDLDSLEERADDLRSAVSELEEKKSALEEDVRVAEETLKELEEKHGPGLLADRKEELEKAVAGMERKVAQLRDKLGMHETADWLMDTTDWAP